jgi:hypothetical protein
MKPLLFLAGFGLIAAAILAPAQAQYAPYPPGYAYAPPISPAQAYPPSWSYDPYTSGQAPCPQGARGETLHCEYRMPPSFGQPSYWPVR